MLLCASLSTAVDNACPLGSNSDVIVSDPEIIYLIIYLSLLSV